jgi:hypothetical protein
MAIIPLGNNIVSQCAYTTIIQTMNGPIYNIFMWFSHMVIHIVEQAHGFFYLKIDFLFIYIIHF